MKIAIADFGIGNFKSVKRLFEHMSWTEKPHTDYPSEVQLYQRLLGHYRKMKLGAGRICWNDDEWPHLCHAQNERYANQRFFE